MKNPKQEFFGLKMGVYNLDYQVTYSPRTGITYLHFIVDTGDPLRRTLCGLELPKNFLTAKEEPELHKRRERCGTCQQHLKGWITLLRSDQVLAIFQWVYGATHFS